MNFKFMVVSLSRSEMKGLLYTGLLNLPLDGCNNYEKILFSS